MQVRLTWLEGWRLEATRTFATTPPRRTKRGSCVSSALAGEDPLTCSSSLRLVCYTNMLCTIYIQETTSLQHTHHKNNNNNSHVHSSGCRHITVTVA